MSSLYTNETLPTSSEEAIREFNERYLAGISAAPAPGWAAALGDVVPVGAPRVTFPIGLMSTKYTETREESGRFKTMEEEPFDLRVVEYDNGYEAKLLDLLTQTFSYRKWNQIPARWAIAEQRHINRQLAALLEAGTSGTTPWDDLAFFHAAHKANPTGDPSSTFSNYQSSTTSVLDLSALEAEVTTMMSVLDENGEKLGIVPDTILVPTEKYEPLKNKLASAQILDDTGVAGVSNPYVGRFNVIHVPELSDTNDWYLVDSKAISAFGIAPWVAAQYRPSDSLGLRSFDESSDFFKNTGRIKMSSHIWYGFALVFPHAIRLVKGA